jgi:hypothetical protein
VRRHVDRHAFHARQEVGAMVEVEAAQEQLVRLPVTRVLRDDQARNQLEDLAGAQERPVFELFVEHGAFARRARPDAPARKTETRRRPVFMFLLRFSP